MKLFLLAVFAIASTTRSHADAHQCDAAYDECESSTAATEKVRADGSSDELLPKCGLWCAAAAANDDAACAIDEDVMPCRGALCATTCERWRASVLDAKDPETSPASCLGFILASHYPLGATLCPDECLLDEIKPNRYPAPTGLGFFCAPGTCDPAAQSRYGGTSKHTEEGLAVLACPCNWFGSDCDDDWIEIIEVVRRERHGGGDLETVVLRVDEDGWRKIVADHKPGGVVRVQSPSKSTWGDRPLEQPYVLATDAETGTVGEIEILTGPPEVERYHPTVTEVARRVRSLPVGPIVGDGGSAGPAKLYINPSVAGFFNTRYVFLMEAFAVAAASATPIEHVAMVATGSGLSGVRSAMSAILAENERGRTNRTVHLYYGIRDIRHLPYRDLIESWTARRNVEVTLLVSSKDDDAVGASEPGIVGAIDRGLELMKSAASLRLEEGADEYECERGVCASVPRRLREMLPTSGKIYAQHALGIDFAAGSLKSAGASLENTAVVVCGRNELLLQTDEILEIVHCDKVGKEVKSSCSDLLGQRVFTNI